MSAYEELIERCAIEIWIAEAKSSLRRTAEGWNDQSEDTHNRYRPLARVAVAEVSRTLETVTPEMENDVGLQPIAARAIWLAMLRASPLAPARRFPS